jgi:hypothetical protein
MPDTSSEHSHIGSVLIALEVPSVNATDSPWSAEQEAMPATSMPLFHVKQQEHLHRVAVLLAWPFVMLLEPRSVQA